MSFAYKQYSLMLPCLITGQSMPCANLENMTCMLDIPPLLILPEN